MDRSIYYNTHESGCHYHGAEAKLLCNQYGSSFFSVVYCNGIGDLVVWVLSEIAPESHWGHCIWPFVSSLQQRQNTYHIYQNSIECYCKKLVLTLIITYVNCNFCIFWFIKKRHFYREQCQSLFFQDAINCPQSLSCKKGVTSKHTILQWLAEWD